jgi:hypothetical protein
MGQDCFVGRLKQADVGDVDSVVAFGSQHGRDSGRQVGVDEQAHDSSWPYERRLVLLNRVGGELESSENVGLFEIRVVSQHLLCGAPCSKLAQDCGDGQPRVRMHGRPRIRPGSMVIRSYAMRSGYARGSPNSV